jgi:hypothetical protein
LGLSYCFGEEEGKYDYVPAMGVSVGFPVYDFDAGGLEFGFGGFEGFGYGWVGADHPFFLVVSLSIHLIM